MHSTPTTNTAPAPATGQRRRPAEATWLGTDVLRMTAWRDPVIEQMPGAIRTDSDDALKWYVPAIGALGVVMAHRFAREAAEAPWERTVDEIARTFGIGEEPSKVRLRINRLETFGVLARAGRDVRVRLWLPTLSYRNRLRLPDYLRDAYEDK